MLNEQASYLVKNNCYIYNSKRIEDRGVLIHDTATPGANNTNFVKSWNVPTPGGREVCVHAFADPTGIINTLPYNYRCWGCGQGSKGSGNSYYVQLEMCVPEGVYFEDGWKYKITKGKEEQVTKDILSTVAHVVDWIIARLDELGITDVNETTVTSHYELASKGLASNHADPKGFLELVNLSMSDIRKLVKKQMEERATAGNVEGVGKAEGSLNEDSKKPASSSSTTSKIKAGDIVKLKSKAVQWDGNPIKSGYMSKQYEVKQISDQGRAVLTIDGVVVYAVDVVYLSKVKSTSTNDTSSTFHPYLVKVLSSSLNIRKGPGTAYDIVDAIKDQGVYTIIEQVGNWGKLKSGIGYINISPGYCEKLREV